MMRLSTILVLVFLGCGQTEQPSAPQSVAVEQVTASSTSEAKRVVVPEKPGAVVDVVSSAELVGRYGVLAALSEPQKQVAVGSLHLVPGPCAPCAEAKEHLARCAMRPSTPACGNISALVGRAAARASQPLPLKQVMESVHYPDIWAPLPGGSVEKVLVDLVLAEADPWAAEALVARAAIEKQFGDTIEVRVSGPTGPVALALGVRATPTWAVAGYRMRGAQSAAALARLIDRELKEYR